MARVVETDSIAVSLDAAEDLCVRALIASNTGDANARSTAFALVRAEADGQKGHGLSRIPSYAAQARAGKVDGWAKPSAERVTPSLVRVDASLGFAYPAIDLACESLIDMATESGVAVASIFRSHHFGQAGAHAERLASAGLLTLIFSNSPKAISFWGGSQAMMGTNPIAFAAPRRNVDPLVIDLALSKVARSKIVAAERANEAIPDTWALDANGKPTNDPGAALDGSMLPIGDAKGAALVLMVELLAAALTGSNFGYEASSFFDDKGSPPNIGHTFIAIEPGIASGGLFEERIENIVAAIERTSGARLPGATRLRNRQHAMTHGIEIPLSLHRDIEAIINSGKSH